MDSGQQQQLHDAISLPPVVGDPAAASSALAFSTEEKPTPTKAGKSCKWNGVTYRKYYTILLHVVHNSGMTVIDWTELSNIFSFYIV